MGLAQVKLGLGTAQFGLPYGIANTTGQVAPDEVRSIVRLAHERGITVVDTAIAYGESEAALGAVFGAEPALAFRVVSKIPKGTRAADVADAVRASLARLAVRRVHAYLLHDVDAYRREPAILDALRALREEGLMEKIGFSVYAPGDVAALMDEGVDFDVVQLPYNLFDRRFEALLPRLAARGVEVHARSVFLQGLFFLPLERLPPHFAPVREALSELRALAAGAALPLAALPLGFALSQPLVDTVVVGVDRVANLCEDLDMAARLGEVVPLLPRLRALEQHDEDILLPTRWKTS